MTSHFKPRPAAGQRQRPGSGTYEEKTNRQQRKLVRVFDEWSANLRREINSRMKKGNSIPEIQSFIDEQMPILEKRLVDVMNAGVRGAANTAAGSRVDNPAVQRTIDELILEGEQLVRSNLIPAIHEKLTLALATAIPGLIAGIGSLANEQQQAVSQAIKTTSIASRSAPAQYAGGYWVAIFKVEKSLGQEKEKNLISQGLPIEPVRWVLDPNAEHCKHGTKDDYNGCPELAREYPGGWNTLRTVPAGHVTCRGSMAPDRGSKFSNCRCYLEVYRNGRWQRGVYDD